MSVLAVFGFLPDGSEILTMAQPIEPRMARECVVGIEPSVHDFGEDLDRAIEVACVSELDGLVEQALGIAEA